MFFSSRCCFIVLGLAPIALSACAEPGPAMVRTASAAPVVGIDLGSSSRIPKIAGLAGEGERIHQSQAAMSGHDHGSMPGMQHGAPAGNSTTSSAGTGRSAAGGTKLAHSGHAHAKGTGTLNSVDAAARKINVTHDPIPAIGWPTMTMDFAVAPSVNLNALTPGTRVNFEMEQGQGGMYVIQSIAPATVPAGARRR